MPEHAQHRYIVATKTPMFGENGQNKEGEPVLNSALLEEYDIYVTEASKIAGPAGIDTNYYDLNMPLNVLEEIKKLPGVYYTREKIEPKGYRDARVFPHKQELRPGTTITLVLFTLPTEGMTVKIDTGNICLYEKMLSTYDERISSHYKNGSQCII